MPGEGLGFTQPSLRGNLIDELHGPNKTTAVTFQFLFSKPPFSSPSRLGAAPRFSPSAPNPRSANLAPHPAPAPSNNRP